MKNNKLIISDLSKLKITKIKSWAIYFTYNNKHYMLKDIVEQFEKGRIKNLDGINLNNDVYVNNNITWKIEDVNFINKITYLV